jgi:hypothetical protein
MSKQLPEPKPFADGVLIVYVIHGMKMRLAPM